MSNRAWVTLATNDSYGLGALVLAHSLRRVNSAYPVVILVTPSVTEAMRSRLSAAFAEVITVDVLDSRDAAHLALLQRPELGITFTKIHCWSLTQYEKCVFLDADTLIVQNCDELFEREELSAAPDVGWPDCFNSGVFVFVPSSDTYTRLITFAQERGSFDGGDQGLLNAFFSDWAHGDINKHLPFLYNVTSAAFYSYLPALQHYGQNLKIIHFIGAAKPWLQRYNWESRSVDAPDHLRELLQQWWDIFVGKVHPNLDSTMEPTETIVENPEEEAPPEVPPQDLQYHYEAKVDSQSEFPWHHPDTQESEPKSEAQILDMSRFYDPWANYKGNGPAAIDYSTYRHESRSEHEKSNFTSGDKGQDQRQYQEHSYQHYYHADHSHQQNDHNKQVYENAHQTNQEQSQHNLSQDYHEPHQDKTKTEIQYHQHNYSTFSQHGLELHNRTPNHESVHSQNNGQQKENDHRDDKKYEFRNGYSSNQYSEQHLPYITRPRAEQVYYLHWDMRRRNRRPRRVNRIKVINEEQLETNGNISDTESEYEEDFRPRHPYDGFYLRHRATINSRGRKVCIHEIPPTPTPSPSPGDLALAQVGSLPAAEEDEYLTASECEDQSGVAGNLARVVPDSVGSQSEALDELTRRQGWEAGNIDYMGADSFANIWAKISQTLSQPPAKQPSPPRKEPSPPKEQSQPEIVKPAETPVQEAVAPVSAPPPVESKLVEPTPPAETAAPVVTPSAGATPAPVQPSAPIQIETAKAVESTVITAPEAQKEKTEPSVPPTPPATPKSSPEAPVTETAPKLDFTSKAQSSAPVEAPKVADVAPVTPLSLPPDAPASASPAAYKPASPAAPNSASVSAPETAKAETTPVKLDSSAATATSTDSPPLATTPSKEDAPTSPATKSEERRKPVEKLQLSLPAAADPLPTPDSEVEDAAALAQSIIASELKVTSPSPSDPKSPQPPLEDKKLNVQQPELPTPPVSLAQIGVKPKAKPTTAAQIESSVMGKTEALAPATPGTPTSTTPGTPPLTSSEPSTPTETSGKKKVIKKVVKKEGGPGGDGSTPVPPPRKKEKKPKDK